jgi:hypothetical protein
MVCLGAEHSHFRHNRHAKHLRYSKEGERKILKPVVAGLLAFSVLAVGQRTKTFSGVITDDVCAREGHAGMRMGPTDAECTRLCVMLHDAAYVLYDGKEVYTLIGNGPDEFAGQKVRVVGTLDAKTKAIHVESITAVE